MTSSRVLNTERAEKAGYRLAEVRLKKHDTIKMDLVRSCRHKLTVQSTFDQSSCVFAVAPKECTSCPASKVLKPTAFNFKGGKRLYQIMHLLQMFVTYVKLLNYAETPREMIVATMLYVIEAGASANPKAVPMEYLDEIYQAIADHAEEHKSRMIKRPPAALDYQTQEGRHVKRKKRTVDIEMPEEVQTIKSYVESLKICHEKHGKAKSPIFQKECDAVAERLTQEKETTLDIDVKKIPNAMRPAVRSSPKRQASKFVAEK